MIKYLPHQLPHAMLCYAMLSYLLSQLETPASRVKNSGWKTVSPRRGVKQQSAGLLNHISTRPIKQWRTKLGPESRQRVHSWAIESLCLHPHFLHHFQSGVHGSYHKLIFALQTRSVQKLPPPVMLAFLCFFCRGQSSCCFCSLSEAAAIFSKDATVTFLCACKWASAGGT